MPFASKAQSRWGHSPSGVKALGGKSKVAEWDSSTDYSKLPAQVKPPADQPGAIAKAAMKKMSKI